MGMAAPHAAPAASHGLMLRVLGLLPITSELGPAFTTQGVT